MIHLTDEAVRASLPWPALAQAIERLVIEDAVTAPRRLTYELPPAPGGCAPGHLLVMPAWLGGALIGIKTVTFRRDNGEQGERSHGASYLLIDGRTGDTVAVLDGRALTERRTAAVSALAAGRLAGPAASRLLVIGTGPVARNLALAHAASRMLTQVEVYGRDPEKAAAMVGCLRREGVAAQVSRDLAASAGAADIISMATSAKAPILRGAWIQPGTHIDLVGSFTPDMREVDDDLMGRADLIWVDTMVALEESGDLVTPLAQGVIGPGAIAGDLRGLLMTPVLTRAADHVTVFKSVGFATPDLAAAQAALAAAV
ncbi:MAG TPA: hypothetical protein VF495_01175, partial [Phenylobacterium sp.]